MADGNENDSSAMNEAAGDCQKGAGLILGSQDATPLEDRLAKEYAGATFEALESLKQKERELAETIKKLAKDLKDL